MSPSVSFRRPLSALQWIDPGWVAAELKNFGGDWEAACTAYCDYEARVTTPDGKSVYLQLMDGFDPAWIREPGSIDVITGSVSRVPLRVTPVTRLQSTAALTKSAVRRALRSRDVK